MSASVGAQLIQQFFGPRSNTPENIKAKIEKKLNSSPNPNNSKTPTKKKGKTNPLKNDKDLKKLENLMKGLMVNTPYPGLNSVDGAKVIHYDEEYLEVLFNDKESIYVFCRELVKLLENNEHLPPNIVFKRSDEWAEVMDENWDFEYKEGQITKLITKFNEIVQVEFEDFMVMKEGERQYPKFLQNLFSFRDFRQNVFRGLHVV